MPYNSVDDSFHTKKLSSRLSSSEVRFFREYGRVYASKTLFISNSVIDITQNI